MEDFTSDCEQCGECCKRGSGFALEEDIKNIAQHFNKEIQVVKDEMFEEVTIFGTTRHRPKTIKKEGDFHGRCIFLQEDNTCKVHDIKPLQCRTVRGKGPKGPISFDWFMINYFVDKDKPSSLREWQIRLEVQPTELGGAELHHLIPDEEIRNKILNYDYEKRRDSHE